MCLHKEEGKAIKINYKGFMREMIQKNPVTISPDTSFFEARNLVQSYP